MVWVRIDDHFDEHPKALDLSADAVRAFLFALCYCNRNLTDGFIPRAIGRRHPSKAVAQLEAAGMWQPVDGGWLTHDFDDYQPTKQQVEEERARKQAAGQAGGRASAQARASASAQAKSNPVPGPVPGPVSRTKKNLTVLPPSTTSTAPPCEFNASERAVISQVTDALSAFGFGLSDSAWREVFNEFGMLHLGLEALKQAEWLRQHRKRDCTLRRYTAWLDVAKRDYLKKFGMPVVGDDAEDTISGCPVCHTVNWDISLGPMCPRCERKANGAA